MCTLSARDGLSAGRAKGFRLKPASLGFQTREKLCRLKSLISNEDFIYGRLFFGKRRGRFPKKRTKPSAACRVFFRGRGPQKNDFRFFAPEAQTPCGGHPCGGALGKKKMKLPLGATEHDFEVCKRIIFDLTKAQKTDEFILNFLHIVYAKGGDYSKKTLRGADRVLL